MSFTAIAPTEAMTLMAVADAAIRGDGEARER